MINNTRNDRVGIDPTLASRVKKKDARGVSEAQNQDGQKNVNSTLAAESYGVHLSSKAREIAEARQKALSVAQSTPEVREDRVNAIKKRIAEGSYQVDAGKVANGIAAEALRDHVALSMHDEAKEA